jgi:uncharacterized protein YjbJ (UPF0337 family)
MARLPVTEGNPIHSKTDHTASASNGVISVCKGGQDLKTAVPVQSYTAAQRNRMQVAIVEKRIPKMDKDRVTGSAEQIKGSVKKAAGKVLGDKKLETEGEADQAAGKVQNAMGGLKDALRRK